MELELAVTRCELQCNITCWNNAHGQRQRLAAPGAEREPSRRFDGGGPRRLRTWPSVAYVLLYQRLEYGLLGRIEGLRRMDDQFWLRKWEINEIGFHRPQPNPLLVRHFQSLRLPPGARVLVPLCGKSRDLHWLLAGGYNVTGIELSPLAVDQLFGEVGLRPLMSEAGPLRRLEADRLRIFVGDVFDLDSDALGAVDAIYDRAALVALPEEMRARYAAHLVAVTRAAPQLLVSYQYDQSRVAGPPFSVTETEVRRLYDASYRIARAERCDVEGGLKGIVPAEEIVWLLQPR